MTSTDSHFPCLGPHSANAKDVLGSVLIFTKPSAGCGIFLRNFESETESSKFSHFLDFVNSRSNFVSAQAIFINKQ